MGASVCVCAHVCANERVGLCARKCVLANLRTCVRVCVGCLCVKYIRVFVCVRVRACACVCVNGGASLGSITKVGVVRERGSAGVDG